MLNDTSDGLVREAAHIHGLAVTVVRPATPSAAPLLFVPGLFAAGWMFDRWMSYFAERGHSTYAVDLRGHGASREVARLQRVSLADYIADALRVAHELGPVIVVGHSMGGLIAQKLAELGAAAAVVLVAPAPPRGIMPISLQLVARQVSYLPALLRSGELRVRRADADSIILNRVPPDDRPAIFAQFEPDSGRVARELMLGAVAVDARCVRCPLLVLAGDDDRFIPLRIAHRIAAKYGARIEVLAGRGHLMMQEPGWEEAAGVIERWLGGL